jgi:hypothetical protein
MRKEKALITMLNGLAKLLSEEAGRNPDFADRLDSLLSPVQPEKTPRPTTKPDQPELPDVYAWADSNKTTRAGTQRKPGIAIFLLKVTKMKRN